jgi:signal-transduction protein with cAMP-binding, CBS, and nucleotidyltransferase domain
MEIGEICTRTVVYCDANATALEVAQLMRASHVGAVLVVDQPNGERVPIGIVTDRDLAVGVMAVERDPKVVQASDVMSTKLVTVGEHNDVYETAELMRFNGVRRVPVVNAQGGLLGIVTMDDLLQVVGEELTLLGRVISRERSQEQKART